MCGNFGLLLLLPLARKDALRLLRQMLRITMVRGAQSAGIVTYEQMNGSEVGDAIGLRCRVVNGKRTDLSNLLLKKLARSLYGGTDGLFAGPGMSPRLFQGHTRFATSSICNLAGCHPHQWVARCLQMAWRLTANGYVSERRHVESFITHNGDLGARRRAFALNPMMRAARRADAPAKFALPTRLRERLRTQRDRPWTAPRPAALTQTFSASTA